MRASVTWIACAIVAIVGSARAQAADSDSARVDPHAVQPERPTVATHAGTVAPGWVELEAGVERDNLHGAHAFLTPTVLKFGVVPRVQLELVGSFVRVSGSTSSYSGAGDLGAALKWRILEHAPVLGNFALQPSVKFPTGSSVHGTGTGTTDVGLLLISSHEIGPLSLDLNYGYVRRSGNGSQAPRDATLWTASGGVPVAGWLGWVGEFFGYPRTSGPAGESSTAAFLTGPTAQLAPWLVLDAGVIIPLAGPQPHSLYAGVTWNIGKL
ncbi:MAG: transporter [Gemmatimonadaceae bacterium]